MTVIVHPDPRNRDRHREIMNAILIGETGCMRESDDSVLGTAAGDLAAALAVGAVDRAQRTAEA